MQNIEKLIKYADVVLLLENIKNSKGIQQKENYIKKFIEYFNERKKKMSNTDSTFYSVLRILLPSTDNRTYGIKTVTMGQIYVNVLGLAPNGEDAKKLTYKSENESYQGDFAEIAYKVLINRPNNGCDYSLYQLHELLDKIAQNDRSVVKEELTKFFEIASPLEQKWFIRIVFKKLRIGIGEQKIFSIYDSRANSLFMKLTDLQKVCEMIESGKSFNIDTVEIQVFQHIKAMLCKKIELTKFKQLFEESDFFYLETKMDGERFQLHMKDKKFKYLSRNGIDYTKNFGENCNEGYLTPSLSKLLNPSIESIILDGEMMVWDKSKQIFCVKGENFDVKHLKFGGNLTPCFVVFDILLLNNIDYLEKPYTERIKKIQEYLKFQIGTMQFCKKNKVHNLEDFLQQFNKAMNDNEEGIVLKHPMSTYKPGIRGCGWYKLKPDYVENVIADLCFVVMGVTLDRSNNYISSYLLGAISKNTEDPSSSKIYSVSTINSGLSNVQRAELNARIQPNLVKEKPENFETGKLLADLWLPLRNTILMDVNATELYRNSDFKTDYSLRFPRILSIRTDKVWLESTTIQELSNETEESSRIKKIYKRNINMEDFSPSKKLKQLVENPYKSNFNANTIQQTTSIFKNLEFCILSGSADGQYTIENLKTIVLQHGGKVVENPTLKEKNCILIAGKIGPKAKQYIGKYSITSYTWLINNFSNKVEKFCRPKPRELLYATDERIIKQKKYFDKYGDSFMDPIDEKELKIIFDSMDNIPLLNNTEMDSIKSELETFCEKDEPVL